MRGSKAAENNWKEDFDAELARGAENFPRTASPERLTLTVVSPRTRSASPERRSPSPDRDRVQKPLAIADVESADVQMSIDKRATDQSVKSAGTEL